MLPKTKTGPQPPLPIPLLSLAWVVLPLIWEKKEYLFFNVDKHVIPILGSDMCGCQDLPSNPVSQGNDWPLSIIIKTREGEWLESQLPMLLPNIRASGGSDAFQSLSAEGRNYLREHGAWLESMKWSQYSLEITVLWKNIDLLNKELLKYRMGSTPSHCMFYF